MATNVLVVDDDLHLCQILGRSLEQAGHAVRSANDSAEALALFESGVVDLALIDVELGEEDGLALLEQLRGLNSDVSGIPALMLTSSKPTAALRSRAKRGGATGLAPKPVPLPKLCAFVEKHAKERPPRVVEHTLGGRDEPGGQLEPFAGDLRRFPFPALLHHLHGLRATGVLRLSAGRKRKSILVREGYPVAIRSNLVSECLGKRLLSSGLIDASQHEESLARTRRGEGLQGEILVAMEALDEEQIAEELRAQAEDKLFEIFGWRVGEFRFEFGAKLRRSVELALDRSPASVIVEGVRAHYPLQRIDRYIQRHRKRYVAPAASPFYRFQEIDLSASERELLDSLDGSRRLLEFADAEESVHRTLFALVLTGMLDLRIKRGASESDRSATASAAPTLGDRELRAELAATADRLRQQSYFEMLGIAEDAATSEVEEAYEALAQRMHPDRYQRASQAVRQLADEVFQRITRAQETLCDPRRRGEYMLELKQDARQAARAQEDRRALGAEVEFQKGEALLRGRQYEAALLCFGNALQQGSDEGVYHAYYGWCLYLCYQDETAMVEEAIEHVKRGLKLARDHEKPYLFLGRLYKATGRGGAAEKMFTRAIQIRPDSTEAMRELRLINMRRQKKGLIGRILRR